MDEILKNIIKSNADKFEKKELSLIEKNFKVFYKLYLIGLINGREIYKID